MALAIGCPGIASWLVPQRAAAETSYQLSVNGNATYTDNVTNAPDDIGPDDPEREAGMLYGVTPGVALNHATPRGRYGLAYRRTMAYSPQTQLGLTGTDALTGTAAYELTPLDGLSGNVSVTNSSFTQLLFQPDTPEGIDGVQNSGTDRLLRLRLSEGWTRQWSQTWSSSQTSSLGTQTNLSNTDSPTNLVLSNDLGVSKEWGHNTFGYSLGISSVQRPQQVNGVDTWSHLLQTGASWSREVGPLSRLSLGLGMSHLLGGSSTQGTGSVGFNHQADAVQLSVTASRAQSADLQTGGVFTTDAARIALSKSPFQSQLLRFSIGLGVNRRKSVLARELAAMFGDPQPTDTVLGNAAVSWGREGFSANLSYTYFRQLSSDSGSPFAIPSLTRNAVTLTLGGAFP